jgi:hypothetical protein
MPTARVYYGMLPAFHEYTRPPHVDRVFFSFFTSLVLCGVYLKQRGCTVCCVVCTGAFQFLDGIRAISL